MTQTSGQRGAGHVLVTGASGRVGQALVTGLTGRSLRLTDRRSLGSDVPNTGTFVLADLNDTLALPTLLEEIDAVVHLAGLPEDAPWPDLDAANVWPMRALAEAAVRAGVRRFVYASSVHVVGAEPADEFLRDDMPLRPDGPYGWSKAVGELSLGVFCDRSSMSGISARICAFQPQPSDARQLRLWLSPGDLVRLVEACLDADFDGHRTIWGVSANSRLDIDRSGWAAVGYMPLDDADAFERELRASGVDTSIVSEWPLLGGRIAAASRAWLR